MEVGLDYDADDHSDNSDDEGKLEEDQGSDDEAEVKRTMQDRTHVWVKDAPGVGGNVHELPARDGVSDSQMPCDSP